MKTYYLLILVLIVGFGCKTQREYDNEMCDYAHDRFTESHIKFERAIAENKLDSAIFYNAQSHAYYDIETEFLHKHEKK